MRRILRLHDTVVDGWRYPDEPAGGATGLILPLKEALARGDSGEGALGVLLAPADAVEELLPILPKVRLVAVEFPGPGEGRGFTQGTLLRQRHHFTGELRARGAAARQDKIFLLARCGFDAFELPPGENEEEARRALHRYTVAYQPGNPAIETRVRFAG